MSSLSIHSQLLFNPEASRALSFNPWITRVGHLMFGIGGMLAAAASYPGNRRCRLLAVSRS